MKPHRSLRWRAALASVFALSLVAGGGAAGANPPAASLTSLAGQAPASVAATADQQQQLTLVTGDRVLVEHLPDGQQAATVEPAPRGGEISFQIITTDDQIYVIPSDAAPLVPQMLDRELFNVTRLLDYGYTDGVPVIISHESGDVMPLTAPAGVSAAGTLDSINATAATIAPDGAWWQAGAASVKAGGDVAGLSAGSLTGSLAGVQKVWLDGLAEVALDASGPLVGAPQAWDLGVDGTGLTVAVLDTGIDENHPDLVGKVAMAENFTDDADETDEHGHGTHVAGTVAGSGDGSDGVYTGVAPGAQVLNGKVCNAGGSCPDSAIIAGMQWGAENADVVNMSLGGGPTDGTDPLSQAVDALTEQHDVLFVISSGNAGPRDGSVGAPGAADSALTVGSVDKNEQLANSSSRGPRVGDFAIKPDITAPGVQIVAPRGAGTSMGTPVDEFYTAASGTSMAAPHVAGAAAIMLQQDGDLSASQLKSMLTAAAVPNDDYDVYEQGGGRLDIPVALQAPVRAEPSPLDLGYFPYPHDEAQPVSAEVSYINLTDDPVSLDLSLQVQSRDGNVASEQMLSVTPASLAVAPGATETATVTLDVSAGEIGLYGGYLIAEIDGEVVTRTSTGFYKEEQMHTLTVEGTARDGRPATNGSFDVLNVEDTSLFQSISNPYSDGIGTVRVPPGTYSVMGVINTMDEAGLFSQERVAVGNPEVEITEDTTLALDARDANPITFDTPEEAEPLTGVSLGWWRQAEEFGSHSHSHTGLQVPQFATETAPVTIGDFEFFSRHRLVAPQLQLSVVQSEELSLDPSLMTGSPAVDGDDQLRLVYAGYGAEEDYQHIDAEDAFVLVDRGPEGFGFADKEAFAAAAGAAAIGVANNQPGTFAGSVGDAATIPTMGLTMAEGEDLRGLLADGEVTVRLVGTAVSPFLYDLVVPHPGYVPDDLHFVAVPDNLATVHQAYHSDVPDQVMNEIRHYWRPWTGTSIGFTTAMTVPQERVEYIVPSDTRYRQNMYAQTPFTGQLQEPVTYYDEGEVRDQSWFKGPLHPGTVDGGQFAASLPTYREGDDLVVQIREWTDAHGHDGVMHSTVDVTQMRLFEDDELIAEQDLVRDIFPVDSAASEHRLELDVTRTADWWTTSTQTSTVWTFHSDAPVGDEELVVPLLELDYRTELDLSNTAPHPRDRRGPATLEITAGHQAEADAGAIAGARMWVSYDDGDTWRERPSRGGGGGDTFEFILEARAPGYSTGYASVRVEAWDVDDNRIEQEIIRAWRMP